MFYTLGMHSDVLAMRGLAVFEDNGDHVVMRTPSEPDFWDGNQVIFRDFSGDARADAAAFRAAFPHARHLSIQWDREDVTPEMVTEVFGEPYDVTVEQVMAQRDPMPAVDDPAGVVMREVVSPEDWAQVEALQSLIAKAEGFEGPEHDAYLRERNENRRAQIAEGHGAWFGAFENGVLAGAMGIFHDHRVARFQEVQTSPDFRRRGICQALLRHVNLWVADREPAAQPVIVAEEDGPAGRIYRRMGFAVVERLPVVRLPGY